MKLYQTLIKPTSPTLIRCLCGLALFLLALGTILQGNDIVSEAKATGETVAPLLIGGAVLVLLKPLLFFLGFIGLVLTLKNGVIFIGEIIQRRKHIKEKTQR